MRCDHTHKIQPVAVVTVAAGADSQCGTVAVGIILVTLIGAGGGKAHQAVQGVVTQGSGVGRIGDAGDATCAVAVKAAIEGCAVAKCPTPGSA